DGPSLAALLYARGAGDDDLDVSSRHVAFWDALFERYRARPQALEDAVTSAGAALARSDASPLRIAQVLEGIARLGRDEPSLEPFPVARVGAGAAELYAAAPGDVDAFVDRNLGSVARAPDEVRVQVLNGNGAPGIGQRVAEELAGEGFRVVLAGNARRFDYRHTLVVTYDASPAGRAVAQRAAEALGVGRVRVSGAGQGIVDLTIVVGKDFLRES
ncbi:MAG TPA: LytR C-terminal domain-containing protein, partial [Actinomycetota bacterium]|nr:LytR C-terminal domain-containing protein [Actinomycetota bacterium]